MAVTPSFVQVAPDSTGKKIDNTQVNNGADDVQRQGTFLGDPETAAARMKVSNARPASTDYGAHVRVVPDGTPYDSGLITLPAVSTLLTATVTRVIIIFLANLTDILQTVTVTDNAGSPLSYIPGIQLGAREVRVIEMFELSAAGLKWFAANAAAVNGQIKGLQ